MRIAEFLTKSTQPDLIQVFRDFLPLAMETLELEGFPPIKLCLRIPHSHRPTFGKYVNEENVIYVAIEDRHPLDIIRTLAHELVHYKQHTQNIMGNGKAGDPTENEANKLAGTLVRKFGETHSQYFKLSAITEAKKKRKKILDIDSEHYPMELT